MPWGVYLTRTFLLFFAATSAGFAHVLAEYFTLALVFYTSYEIVPPGMGYLAAIGIAGPALVSLVIGVVHAAKYRHSLASARTVRPDPRPRWGPGPAKPQRRYAERRRGVLE